MKMQRIEISSLDPITPLSVDLEHILAALDDVGENTLWYVLDWEGLSNPGPAMYALQRELARGVVAIPWLELRRLGTEVRQTQDALIVGIRGIHHVPIVPFMRDVHENMVAIEAISNQLWAVSTDLPEVIEALEGAFRGTEQVRRV